jgi:hypothetical protein
MKKGGFCRFARNLYWGNSVKKRPIVKWKLYHGSGQLDIYCITRAAMEQDQLDIIHCAFLKQKYYRENPVLIYGIANGRKEAMDLVLRISQEASIAGMDGRLLDYLTSLE